MSMEAEIQKVLTTKIVHQSRVIQRERERQPCCNSSGCSTSEGFGEKGEMFGSFWYERTGWIHIREEREVV